MSDCGLTGLTFKRPSLVKVNFADECDISLIVKRFVRTGELPNLAVKTPLNIADTAFLPQDFQELQEQNVAAKMLFEREPLALRELLNHDVEKYFAFRAMKDEEKIAFLKENAPSSVYDSLVGPSSASSPPEVTPPSSSGETLPPAGEEK